MKKNKVINSYIEKIELLPDQCDVAVSRSWCFFVTTQLTRTGENSDLLSTVSRLTENIYQRNRPLASVSRYVTVSVGDVKKMASICDVSNFNCCFPQNYDQIVDEYLSSKLGENKDKIVSLIVDNKIDDVFTLVNDIEDRTLKKLSLLYAKYVYNIETERKIMDFNISRVKTINKIDTKLY